MQDVSLQYPKIIDDNIQFLTDTANLLRMRKLKPRKSFCSDFLEKVQVGVKDVDKKTTRDDNA